MSPRTATLLKFLTECNLGSRRSLADAIRQGKVEVNGSVAENFKQEIYPDKDLITLDGQSVTANETVVCLMLNKPAGVLTTTSDDRGRRTVIDLIPEEYKKSRLYPIGRLDKDSTGLILLTNDGNLTYRLTHPKFEHEKEYLIAIRDTLKSSEKKKLERGVKLEDGKTYPAMVKTIRNTLPFNYSITIHEGRKRQVRRMFEELGHPVIALQRVRMGMLRLGKLEEGKCRPLSRTERRSLLSNPKR